jgi:hypothetical protein
MIHVTVSSPSEEEAFVARGVAVEVVLPLVVFWPMAWHVPIVDATRINSNSQLARIAMPTSGMRMFFTRVARQKKYNKSKRPSVKINQTKKRKLKKSVLDLYGVGRRF